MIRVILPRSHHCIIGLLAELLSPLEACIVWYDPPPEVSAGWDAIFCSKNA
jgi:hypothetical protein